MIKKNNLILLFFCLFIFSFDLAICQSTPPSQSPKMMPPSPEAASLGKYGDFSVGMFSGTPSFSISLYDLKTANITVPISLNYSSNGLKVDDLSSRVGMNWALNAGGAITRTVFDKPDFGLSARASLPPQADFNSLSASNSTVTWMSNITSNELDTQMDEFNFSFLGYSGKFIIGLDNKPILMPFSPLKIEFDFNRSDWNFKITTADGYKYFFGGSTARETSYSSGCNNYDVELTPNSWFLIKIEHPYDVTDYVEFIYQPVSYSYTTGVNQTLTYFLPSTSCTDNANGPCGSCGTSPFIYGRANSVIGDLNICTNSLVVAGVLLKQISDSKYTKVLFNYVAKPDINSGNDSLVDKITVFNKETGEQIKLLDLNYFIATPLSSFTNTYLDQNPVPYVYKPRPFLTEVKEFGKSGTVFNAHTFTYNDVNNLPRRLSFAQDYWGYFNGVNNTRSFIPKPERNSNLLPVGMVANRNPDYSYASKGMLTKITYPTGGSTTIEYEGNTLDSGYVGGGGTSTGFSQSTSSILINSSNRSATFQVNETITVQINKVVECNCPTMANCPPKADSEIWGQLLNSIGTVLGSFTFEEYNLRGECSKSSTSTYVLPPGIYALGLFPSAQAPYITTLSLTVQTANKYVYITSPGTQLPSTTALATTGGGVRVKRIINDDVNTGTPSIKKYEYTEIIFAASPKYANKLLRRELNFLPGTTNGVTACIPDNQYIEAEYVQFNSSSLINLFGIGASPVYYSQVTEYQGINGENGGIEHNYSYSGTPTFIPLIGEITTSVVVPKLLWKNGLETTNLVFKLSGTTKVPVEKKFFTYTTDNRKLFTAYQYLVASIGDAHGSIAAGMQASMFTVSKIPYVSEWQYLSSERTESYNSAGSLSSSITKDFYYDNELHGQLTRTEFTNSVGKRIKEIRKYSGDTNISGLTPAEVTSLSLMGTQYRVGEVVETDQLSDGLLRERKHSVYNNINAIPLIKATNISISTSPAFTSFSGDEYDAQGRLISFTNINGIKVARKYGYNNDKIIAEILGSNSINCFYASFEDAEGNSSLADCFTGKKSKTSGYSKVLNGLTNGAFVLSYWQKVGSVWSIQTNNVTVNSGSYTITLTGQVDDVRFLPANAQMTSYTYDPLLGITSKTDPTNVVMFFEYDNFNRLLHVKDMWGKILKKMEYKYIGQ